MSKTITVSDEQSSEPVAWRYIDCSDEGTCCHIYNEMKQGEPLYLHPRTPLSDEEILAIAKEQAMKLPNPDIDIDFARAIERAHGITE